MVKASDRSAAEVKRVNQQLEERHYEFRSNCNDGDGDASACHSWGEWLAVVDKNYKDAANMYELNCSKNGYPASCFNLGRLKLAGKGAEQNDPDAFKLFGKFSVRLCHMLRDGKLICSNCDRLGREIVCGRPRCCLSSLGLYAYTRHWLREGRPQIDRLIDEKRKTAVLTVCLFQDFAKALAAFKEGCERDDANSCNRVATMYLRPGPNSPIKRDIQQAKTYLEKACDANFAPACHNLAVMYKKGDESIPKDQAKYEEYRAKTEQLIEQAGGMSSIKSA
ncbi:Tetratricopeptide-like helical domain [Phytophthora cactorum]|nr:Tetratricopeptide-like helical domain [Phytophthora cactorum]